MPDHWTWELYATNPNAVSVYPPAYSPANPVTIHLQGASARLLTLLLELHPAGSTVDACGVHLGCNATQATWHAHHLRSTLARELDPGHAWIPCVRGAYVVSTASHRVRHR